MESYRDRFNHAIRQLMADNPDLKTRAEVARWLGVGKVTLYNIMDGRQQPTVEQIVTLCKQGGFSADWILLGGSGKNEIQEDLKEIKKLLRKIDKNTASDLEKLHR